MYYTDEEKAKLVELVSKSGLNIKEACRSYGFSDASYYTWRKQLASQNEKPKGPEQEEPDPESDAKQKLISLKKEHPYFGVVKLSKQLLRTYGLNLHPGKVKRILDDHGFKTEALPKAPPKGTRRFERTCPKELFMMDIMYYRLKKEGRFYLISILDDYSRFIVAHKVCTTQAAENVTSVFQEAVETYGLPNQLLTDRGSQFASWKGINAFQELLGNLGVEHILTKSQSPQTIGKIESFHRNIQKELLRQKQYHTIKEAREAIKEYIRYYNFERVHMGIGYLTPADRFFNSAEAVEKAVDLSSAEGSDFYLTGILEGQPVRLLKDKAGKVTIYLAGHPVKELENTDGLKTLFFPA